LQGFHRLLVDKGAKEPKRRINSNTDLLNEWNAFHAWRTDINYQHNHRCHLFARNKTIQKLQLKTAINHALSLEAAAIPVWEIRVRELD